jgi:hypothetical protein
MGVMYFGSNGYRIEIDDRPLSHLKVALLTLLRADRSVAFSFQRPASAGGGRETLWITPTTELRFRFYGSRPPRINETWVRAIIATADETTGFRLIREPSGFTEVLAFVPPPED